MAGNHVDPAFWHGRRVMVTGHTGFKGTWLALWLSSLGAEVAGFSRGVPSSPSLYELVRLGELVTEVEGDVRDHDAVRAAIERVRPEVLIHMAAQPLVRRSFKQPRETYETNVMGTVNVLEAVRVSGAVRVVVNVTSDKCYENRGSERGFREGDELGGDDPYSSSKAMAELVSAAYRRSFFDAPADGPRLATVRAGNVIGGGDWGADRLVPDIMRAAVAGEQVRVRNPDAVRPWQHVLNPLSGYLLVAQALWDSAEHARAWNFGPAEEDARPVSWLVEHLAAKWPGELRWVADPGPHPHEAHFLKLDSSLARELLGWRPVIDLPGTLESIVDWYCGLVDGRDMRAQTLAQIEANPIG